MEDLTLAQLQMIIGDALMEAYYLTGNKPSEVLKAFEDKIRADERESVLAVISDLIHIFMTNKNLKLEEWR